MCVDNLLKLQIVYVQFNILVQVFIDKYFHGRNK